MKLLEAERRGLKQASLDKQNILARTLLATNRLVATRLGGMVDGTAKKGEGFRGGVEPIAHVLPPEVQRALHSKLCTSTKNGEKEVMDMLLRYDVDLDYSDTFGTPLHYAAYFGQLQAASILLDKGAFPGALNYREQTPLHVAASRNAHTVVDMLVRYGAPLNAIEMGGLTAMHLAATAGFCKVIDNLIMGGADCDKQNRIGWSPLHLACMGMHHEVIEKLCISGMANTNAGCSRTKGVMMGKGHLAYIFPVVKGDTAGHFAARRAYFMCLKVLLENGADTAAANEDGETMMHLAVISSDMRCVERILEYGWDFIDMVDKHGRDPIDVCDDVLADNTGDDAEPVRIRRNVNDIKTLLQKTSVRKNQQAHKAMMDKSKKGVGGRKKRHSEAPPALEADEEGKIEIEETPLDDRTMDEKIQAMKIELESARAEARASEAQSRMKTYDLNESLMEAKRRLVETEFMLERERESRLALEQDVLGLIGTQKDEDNLKGGDKGQFSAQSLRIGTSDNSTYDFGATYERMQLPSAHQDRHGSPTAALRPQSILWDNPHDITCMSSVMKKDFSRSLSGTSVKFAETETLDDELDEYERTEASSMAGAPPRQPLGAGPSVLKQPGMARSRGQIDVYSASIAHDALSFLEVSSFLIIFASRSWPRSFLALPHTHKQSALSVCGVHLCGTIS